VIGVLPAGVAVNHFQNVLIDSNLVIRQTDTELAFPTYLQGIDASNSDWTNMTVTNNVVITSACWGIHLISTHNGLIANNTVIEDGLVSTPGCEADVSVSAGSTNTVVRNNLSSQLDVDTRESGVVADHNVVTFSPGPRISWYVNGVTQRLGNPGAYANGNIIDAGGAKSEFVNFNPSTLTFNVMLKAGAQAIGAGTATGAPTLDILGAKRVAPYTAGAYSYPE
jgi:parallel beta-helix repeat protein